MNKILVVIALLGTIFFASAQESSRVNPQEDATADRFPVFTNCQNFQGEQLRKCFYDRVQDFVNANFMVPQDLIQNNFNGNVKVLFEVNADGVFKVIYTDAVNEQLLQETKRVFLSMPKISPATYNGKPTYSRFTMTIPIPLQSRIETLATTKTELPNVVKKEVVLTELDSIVYKKFDSPEFESNLNIPFSHSYYAQFDAAMNQMGSNNHTASKPFTYAQVAKYYDFKSVNQSLQKNTKSWWAKKLWNENLVQIKGEDYWFTLNPILDLQVGSATDSKSSYTYTNTRGINFRGGLGKNLHFTTTVFESQGRFADYYNNYAISIRPDGGNPAIIPGIGIAKEFKTDAFDFPSADANLTFTPSKYLDMQLGYSRNFIGDGYRSLLESDGASPYPYFKLNTNFWKIKYTNTYMWLKDVRPEVTTERTYATKFMANHYLSWNVSNRLNLGFFESVVWTNTNDRGFDVNFVNPIIFYRSVEFTSSARSGNAILGLTFKYKWNNAINFYGQFILDEFSLGDVKEGNNSWKNKYGYQVGAKYYNAFGVKNLLAQVEYNHVRPYVYSHSAVITNYGHNNQSLGHQWGGNFRELIGIARYHQGRLFADAKVILGTRGFDFNIATDSFNYGGNIYKNYDNQRPFDSGVKVGQGNKTAVFIADLQAGYLINPSTNLKLFGSLIYRSFNPDVDTVTTFKQNTTWFSMGVRADIFNWYFDY